MNTVVTTKRAGKPLRRDQLRLITLAEARLRETAKLCADIMRGAGYSVEERMEAGKRRRALLSMLRTLEKMSASLLEP
ncbi:MAG: hypothetical protein E6Q97_09145 [Desulfurellales bacterium]|nr:MAG: hypothetical protein E6Q97_09145 [Desulfurellales bacterium]